MQLQNKVALITGGSAGIGLALARRMVQQGASVALVARGADKLNAVVDELTAGAGPGRVAAFPADVHDRAALDRLPGAVVERFGGLDIVVNNAGLNHRGPILGVSAAQVADVVDVNLAAPMFLSRRALDYLRPGGALVQMSSLAGKVPFSGQAAYCATKAGLRAFSRALYEELKPRDIHVLCVNPGPVDTDFFGDISRASDLTFSQPMSTPDQVADATLRGLQLRLPEVDIPAASGKLATLGYLSPGLTQILRPILEWRGALNKARYMRKKGQL